MGSDIMKAINEYQAASLRRESIMRRRVLNYKLCYIITRVEANFEQLKKPLIRKICNARKEPLLSAISDILN